MPAAVADDIDCRYQWIVSPEFTSDNWLESQVRLYAARFVAPLEMILNYRNGQKLK